MAYQLGRQNSSHVLAEALPAPLTGRRTSAALFRLFCQLYLAATMGLFAVLFVPYGGVADGASNPTFLGAWALLYICTWILLLLGGLRINAQDRVIAVFCALAVASTLWSDNPTKTFVYGIAFVSNVAFAALLRRHFSLSQILDLVLETIVVLSVLGMLLNFSGFQPTRYIDVHDRTTLLGTEPMRGLSNHKITAGLYAAIGIVLCFWRLRGGFRVMVCGLLLLFLLLTGSSSSLAILFVGLGILGTVHWLSRRSVSPVVFFLTLAFFAAVVSFAVLSNVEGFLNALGRDATLTGRTTLWAWGTDVAFQKPLFGWGFLGYMESDSALAYARSLPGFSTYEAPHFHNSYIQMFVELGLVGLGICVLILIAAVMGLYADAARRLERPAVAACAIVIMLSFAAIFVHVFFKYNDFPSLFLLLMFSYAAAARKRT